MFHELVQKLNFVRNIANGIIEKIVGIIVLVMFSSLFTQVCCRYFFHSALSWPEELTMFLMAWMSFLGAAVALHRWGHIGIDFFLNKLSGKYQRALLLVIRLIVLGFTLVLLDVGIDLVASSGNVVSDGMRIPMIYPRLSMPIGAGLMVFNVIIMILEDIDMLVCGKENRKEAL